ncbi:MAG: AbiH family protein [Oscillospiraceae bacterium]
MNVLIIGNGFDIAHKLPTEYTSFLDFIKFINRFETYNRTAQEFELDNENYKFFVHFSKLQ